MDLAVLFDVRARGRWAALTRAVLRVAARHCSELLSVAHIAQGAAAPSVAVGVVTARGLQTIADCTDAGGGGGPAPLQPLQDIQAVQRALERVEEWGLDTEPSSSPSLASGGGGGGGPSLFGRSVIADAVAAAFTRGSAPNGRRAAVLLVTAHAGPAEAFSALATTAAALPPGAVLQCVAVDAAAAGLATVSLGPGGLLHSCSAHPDDVRAAVQAAAAASGAMDGGVEPPVPVVLRLGGGGGGGGAVLQCVAARPYLSGLRSCVGVDGFPDVQDGRPSLVIAGGGARLAHSGFEVAKAAEGGAVVPLTLEAVLRPADADDAALFDSTWLLTSAADSTGAAATAFHAAFAAFQDDVLLLRGGGGGGARLAGPHQLALKSAVFIAYFSSATCLLLRQVVPRELRRRLPTSAAPLRRTAAAADDGAAAAAAARMQAARAEALARGSQPSFDMDLLLEGGVRLLAAQMRPERDLALQLVNKHR